MLSVNNVTKKYGKVIANENKITIIFFLPIT